MSSVKQRYMSVLLWSSCVLALGCGSRDIGAKRQELGAFTISGTVYGGSSPLANVQVTAVLDGTQTSVASATTDSSGAYSLSVDAGTFDLLIDAPAGSGYSDDQVQNVVVSGNVRQDIVLIAESEYVEVSGTLTGHGGNPVANSRVYLYNSPQSYTTTTGASGEYSLSVPAGTYSFQFQYGSPYSPHAPQGYYYCNKQNVAISGNTVLDYALPVNRLYGQVRGDDGVTVGDTQISLWGYYNASNENCYVSYSVTADASGNYDALVFSDTSAQVRPPAAAPYGNIHDSFTVSGDTQRDFTLPSEVVVSGVVTGHGGAPLENQQVSIHLASGTVYAYTDANGAYSLAVPPGTYNIQVYRNAASPSAPQNYSCTQRDVVVSGATTTSNVALPVVRVAGRVIGSPGDVPVPGTSVQVFSSHSAGNLTCSSNAVITADASANYELMTLPGSSHLAVVPPDTSGYAAEYGTATWNGDTSHDITVSAGLLVSGVITGHQGNVVEGAYVRLYRNYLSVQQLTDANGRYSMRLQPGTYSFQVRRGAHSPHAPSSYYYCSKSSNSLTADTQMDFALPVARVLGNISDNNGAPVPGTQVQATGMGFSSNGVYCGQSSTWQNSDASGGYSLMLLESTPSFTIRPPTGSGFFPVSISNVDVSSDLRQDIRLQRPDREPPVIVSGPEVIHLSDTSVSINWVTNEPSDSAVHYGIGGLTETIRRTELVTTHSVTLVGLDATSLYTYRVSSTDEHGNGPTTRDGDDFRTMEAPGDIVPPTITSGPVVAFVDQSNALIQWQTDEPTDGVVHFGDTTALGQTVTGAAGLYVQSHLQLLTGLQPSTTYHAKVESSDPDGNGPAVSDIISFTTTPAPDTTAPQIVAGPTVLGVTDTTITITWDTDEVATSGVSYTDGQAYGLITDNALVTAHTITITQLTPNTTYTLTTSSRDTVGNGPTLGGPIQATTSAQPDTTPPVISNIATAATVNSAEIEWTTDEPANSSVVYSAVSPVPEHSVSAVALVTAHSLFLQGLHPATTYNFAVLSTDTAGNQASSQWLTFTTDGAECEHPEPIGESRHCRAGCPCGEGAGDCDSDDECLPGLTCVRDVGASYGWDVEVDVCEATCHPSALGGRTYCRAGCPCEAGEGDCDSNDECAPGLTCVFNVGASYGWDADVDVCEATCHPSALGTSMYCRAGCPCEAGEGDCDSDDECASGLICVRDVGASYGWAPDVDVCEVSTNLTQRPADEARAVDTAGPDAYMGPFSALYEPTHRALSVQPE